MLQDRATRRSLLRRSMLGMAAAGSLGLPVLAACSSPAPSAAPTVSSPTAAAAPKPSGSPLASVTAAAAKPTAAATGSAGAASVAAALGQPVVVGGVRLPTYVPYAGAQPDSPGSPDGMVDAGY
ncbi:MAG TPA: hypothetical protein VF937_02065, partial [Chloroflexota bacterium]